MSTEIKQLETLDYDRVVLTRFHRGGHGAALQLTVSGQNGVGYVHMSKEQAHELGRALLNSFDYQINPSY